MLLIKKTAAAALRMGLLAGWLGLGCGPAALAQSQGAPCGDPFSNGYGPYDYRSDQGPKLKIVEDNHFTWNIEALVRGNTAPLGAELAYTLRAYPNHHRALVAMMNLGSKLKSANPTGAGYSVECFFIRAISFRPDDTVARMLFAKYLAAGNRKAEAVKQLEYTTQYAKDNGFTHYNIGLSYLDLKEYTLALTHAHRALALGFERPLLKQQLQAAGKWQEPEPEVPAQPASAPPPAPQAEPASAPAATPGVPAASAPG